MTDKDTQLDRLFAALGDRTRRAMLLTLLEGEITVTQLAEPFEISLAAISKHLQILARAGLVETERRGREKICRLNPDAMVPAALWLETYGAIGSDVFDLIEAMIEED